MGPETFCRNLIAFLEDFDRSIPPLGLYACDDLPTTDKNLFTNVQEEVASSRVAAIKTRHLGLKPRLELAGCRVRTTFLSEGHSLDVPDVGETHLKILKISKIKVRKFGSHYRVDRTENYRRAAGTAWDSTRNCSNLVEGVLSLADGRLRMRVLLFIGFDKADDPFSKELSRLKEAVDWDAHDVTYETKVFTDLYERNFHIRLSAWARLA